MTHALLSGETDRVSALARYGIVDSSPETAFDDLAQLAASLCNAPFAVVAFVDREREWFKARVGLDRGQVSRSAGFSSHTVTSRVPLIVCDAQADPRFSAHELVTGAPHVRYYCGVPVVTEDGYAVGTLAVMDRVPRAPKDEDALMLERLAGQVTAQLTLRRMRRDQLAVGQAPMQIIAAQMEEAVIVTGCDGRVLYVTHAAERLLGLTSSDLVGRSLHDTVHSHDSDRRRMPDEACELRHACAMDATSRCGDDGFLRQDGSIARVSWTVEPLLRGGRCEGHVVTVRDLGYQKRSEEVLQVIAGTRESFGLAFLQDLVERLTRATGAEYGFCSLALLGTRRAQALAGCGPDGPIKDFDYDVAGTPCETVIERGFCHYPADVQTLFPQDHVLRRFGVSSYMALVLPSGTGESIGWIALLGRAPLRDPAWAEALLRTSAGRAGSELAWEKAQQRLKESEERFALALEGTSDGVWDWNPLTGRLYLSRRWKELLGFAEHELPNREEAFFSRVHPDDAQKVGVAVREHLGQGIPYDVECRLLHKDGRYRWMRSRGKAVRNEAGQVNRMVGSMSDITERKLLDLDAHRWKQVFEQAEFGLAYGDVKTDTLLSVNQAFARQLGYEVEELIGRPIISIYAPEARAHMQERLRTIDQGGHLSYESLHQRKDGTTFPVWMEVTVIRDEHGRPLSRVAYAKDITGSKRAERALGDREAELRMALEAAEEGTFDYDVGSDRTTFSDRALRMFGFEAGEQATYGDCTGRIHPDDRVEVVRRFGDSMRERTEFQAEYRVRLPGGQIRWLFAKGRGFYGKNGDIERAVGVLLDVTDRRRTESLREGQRAILELIARNAPLTETLTQLCRVVEAQGDGILSSILILNGNRLRHAAGPSLPSEFNAAVDGVKIGPAAGSCGTAAYHNETVIVSEIAEDVRWEDFREIALRHGLRACWSTPIRNREGKVMGTFAVYSRTPRPPSARERDLIETGTYLGGIAMERYRNEQSLRDSEERFRLVAEATNDILWDWDLTTNDHWWSPNACERFAYDPRTEPSIEAWISRLHHDDKERILTLAEGAVQSDLRTFAAEYRFRLADGTYGHFLDRAHIVRNEEGKAVRLIGAMIDVTGPRRAYASLEAAYHRLRAMSQELQTVESNERRRLSRELHDEVGQLLTSLKFDLTSVTRSLAGGMKSAGGRSRERLARALETTDLLFTRLRQVVRALRPPVLDELGLKAGLDALIADVQARTGLRCTLQFDRGERRAPRSPTVETAVYRIVQELLTNVIRHAQARHVSVEVHEGRGEWNLIVKDDGVGFDVAGLSPFGGFGLRGIRERVEILAGQVDIVSTPGVGTSVQARIPVGSDKPSVPTRATGATKPRRRRRNVAHE